MLKLHWITPGSLLATVLFFVITAGFSFYVANFGEYAGFYGSIGAVIVLLLWLNFSSMGFLAGGELDAALNKRYADLEEPNEDTGRREDKR